MFLNAYYLRAHMYTLVPRHVREDMAWMAGVGNRAVTVAVLEQDLFAAVENLEIVQREAERAGLQLYVVPSRWGSLVAGAPKVPSIFSARNPEACMQNRDGSPLIEWLGPIASVHHPATFEFFCRSLERLSSIVPVSGIIWDEPKALALKDYSPAARQALAGKDMDDAGVHVDAQAEFFDRVGAEVLRRKADLRLCMFLHANMKGYAVERCAGIRNLHDFGCDGRPFQGEDGGGNDSDGSPSGKLLCDYGPYFVTEARKRGKRPLLLIENHAMSERDMEIMDTRLPEVLNFGAEHLIYYYSPRSLRDPDRNMAILAGHLRHSPRLREDRRVDRH